MARPASGGAYRTLRAAARAELRERGSRFVAALTPVEEEGAAKQMLAEFAARHADATHRCWAWRLGDPPRERRSDAGEPAGTAGAPILRALRAAELSDVVAVVMRWFGGTNLGRGGLVRAYGGVVRAALEGAAMALREPTERLEIELPYERVGALQRLVRPPEVEIESESWGETAQIVLRVRRQRVEELRDALAVLGVPRPEPDDNR